MGVIFPCPDPSLVLCKSAKRMKLIGDALLPIARREGVFGGWDGVLVADLAVTAVDHHLAATLVPHDLSRSINSLCLCVVMPADTRGAWLLHIPATLGVRRNMTVVLAHVGAPVAARKNVRRMIAHTTIRHQLHDVGSANHFRSLISVEPLP